MAISTTSVALVCSLVTAACGGHPAPATLANHAAAPSPLELVACPGDLEQVTRVAWKEPSGELSQTCTAFVSGQPLWLIDGYASHDDATDGWRLIGHTALVAARTHAVVSSETDPDQPPSAVENTAMDYDPVDLDGDGTDELIEVSSYMNHGYEESSLGIGYLPRGSSDLMHSASLPLLDDNEGAAEDPKDVRTCSATHVVVPGPGTTQRIEIVGTATGDVADAACPKLGVHVYRWDGAQLVEVSPGAH